MEPTPGVHRCLEDHIKQGGLDASDLATHALPDAIQVIYGDDRPSQRRTWVDLRIMCSFSSRARHWSKRPGQSLHPVTCVDTKQRFGCYTST